MNMLAQIAFDSLNSWMQWDSLTDAEQQNYIVFCDAVKRVLVEEIAKLADAQNTYQKQDAVNLAAELVERMK
jgi:hypothetical protein